MCVCVYFECVCCSICNFGLSRKCFTQKNSLCASNFALNWGENATDKSLKGSLFCRPENCFLTLVRMGELVTSNAVTYGSYYSMKQQNSPFSVYCFTLQKLSEIIKRLLYYSTAKKIPFEDSVEFVILTPLKLKFSLTPSVHNSLSCPE
jgi:hypothetical protein